MRNKSRAIFYAILAAALYSLTIPFSKVLLQEMPPILMGGMLYVGAGLGIGILYLFNFKKEKKEDRLTKDDLGYTMTMICLDIIAPVLLMFGVSMSSSANATLLNNFEIVATALVALFIFKEKVSKKLWIAIGIITVACIVLTFEGEGAFQFSFGSLLVLGAATCWAFENNCTKKLSHRSSFQVVTINGLASGPAAIVIGLFLGERFPAFPYVLGALLLGGCAFGLSIFVYIKAQHEIGAAKTSAFYALAPFMGSFLAFIINKEALTWNYFVGLVLMIIGTIFVIKDTLQIKND